MQKRVVRKLGARSRTARRGPWLVLAGSALVCAACGETNRTSANSANGGSDGWTGPTTTATTLGNGVSSGGASPTSSTAVSTFTAVATSTATTAPVEPAAGGAPTSTTSEGLAGADPLGPGGSAADDECEVVTLGVGPDICQLEIRCALFVQHTNCRSPDAELWQCDTDEHDNSKPHTLEGNPFWYNAVTGAADAMQACEAVVDLNLDRGSVTPVLSDDCSELTLETEWDLSYAMLCGPRYQASSGVTVWDAQPAMVTCSDRAEGANQACTCARTESDDGEYLVEAPDLESALADVWAFCANSSPRVPVEQGVCDPVADTTSGAGCEFIDNCPLVVTDDSGIELEQLIYQEILCEPDTAVGMLNCSCRVGVDRQFSFVEMAGQQAGVSACEDLAEACNARYSVERAEGPAECERVFEYAGRDQVGLSYLCEVPVTLGGRSGFEHAAGRVVCTEQADGLSDCVCHDDFTSTSTSLEPAAPDLGAQWEIAVAECEALLEADPGAP